MAALRTLLLLLGALGVLLLGAQAPAMAETSMPPCHGTAAMIVPSDTGPAAPERPLKTMGCCVACIAAPAIVPPIRAAVAPRRDTPVATPKCLPRGRSPSPETGPPKA